jgi:hypothetical protein
MFGGGGVVTSKYPPTFAGNMNARPSGGMGGLGIIQFMAPPGTTIIGDNAGDFRPAPILIPAF